MNQAINLQLDAKTRAIMQCVDALERSEASDAPDLRSFLQEVAPEYHADALAELARVDLERQWTRGARPDVGKYLSEYPELRTRDASVLELLQTDFELRQKKGCGVDLSQYHRWRPGFKPRGASETDHSVLPTQEFFGRDLSDRGPEPQAPLRAPERVGKYRIERKLGAGGFGVVYLAFDEQLLRPVALKIRRGGDMAGAGLSDDLLHEARSIAQLDHPNIVRLWEAGETPDHTGYVAYEYIEGETLREAIQRGDYDHAQAAQWVAQTADALHYAHRRKIVHRDIKPANIMLDSARRPKVLDFGLARRDDAFYRDDSRQIMGTFAYMSPEQAAGDSHWASSQSDIYSLGVVFYELLCRRLPFQSNDANELLDQTLHRTPPPPRSIDDTIPKGLEDACLRALAKSPAERFTTGADMATAVRQAVAPRKPWASILVRSAAAMVAVASLCVAAAALLTPAGRAPAPPPEISSYNLLLADTEIPVNGQLPLTLRNRLKVEATFTSPAYAYLLVFEQQSTGQLVWPPRADLERQRPVSRLIYPPLAGGAAPLAVPDRDGAMFVVAIASREPLSREAVASLLETPLELNVSPEVAAQAQTSFQVADPPPKFHQGIPTRAGVNVAANLRVPDSFKQMLHRHGNAYLGNLVPHVKAAPRAKE